MGIIDNFKEVFKVAETVNNIDLYKKLAELQTRAMEVEEENRALKDQVSQLTDQLATKQSLKHDGERYWIEKDGSRDGPFCSVCWDIDKKLVRMRNWQLPEGEIVYVCDYCGSHRSKAHR